MTRPPGRVMASGCFLAGRLRGALRALVNDEFRLLFTADLSNGWKLNASNPEQYYYNRFYAGPGDEVIKLSPLWKGGNFSFQGVVFWYMRITTSLSEMFYNICGNPILLIIRGPMRRILIACLLVIVLLIGPALSARADLAVIELSLNTGGSAFEIHADWNENLWISDYASGEIWRIIANGGLAQVYSVGGNPSDAFPDGMGNVWWVDGPQLRRMNITTGEILTWAIPGGGRLWGVEVGYPGKVWASDDGTNQLISFDAESSWFCSYALGTDSQAYPALSGSQVWVGDTWQSKILRLDRDANLVTWWQLPENYKPNDIAIGYDGTVWFTDAKIDGFGGLNQLDPATGVVTEFALPYGFATKMLANSRGNIWYTEMNWDIERNWGTFGRLDPTFVSGSTYTPTSGTNYAYPSCSNLSVDSVSYAYIQDDTSGWSTGTYTSLVDGDGWKVYRLPDGSNPVGIAITQSGWLVDLGRKVLVNFEAGVPPMGNIRTYIPMVMR